MQEQADTMKMQLDAQRKALDNLLGNTKCGPSPLFYAGNMLGTAQGFAKVFEGSIVEDTTCCERSILGRRALSFSKSPAGRGMLVAMSREWRAVLLSRIGWFMFSVV